MHSPDVAQTIAQRFHESYERLAPEHGYKTREASAVGWAEVPQENRSLMVAVVEELIEERVIEPGPESHGGAAGYTRDQLRGQDPAAA